jgi:CRISPR-associated protein Cas1
MGFRTVIIDQAVRINLDLNNIVVYYQSEYFYVNLDEINTIIISDPRCNVTLKLLSTLCEKGITTIFTNSSHMPIGTLTTLYNHSRAAKKNRVQINWDDEVKRFLWTEIIRNKIILQKEVLKKVNKTEKINILEQYIKEIKEGDITNREGLASRTYFKELFGDDFKRFNDDMINFALNYSYQIIRAKISQEIVAQGYNPSYGIFHKSEYNTFNLADDFIEVYRPIIDYNVYLLLLNDKNEFFTSDLKQELCNIINKKVIYNYSKYKIYLSIELFLQSMFSFLETGEVKYLVFPELL